MGLTPVARLSALERARMWRVAEAALVGVGDAAGGEWREEIERSLHLKRRLTADEWGAKAWGMDYRGTWEGQKRLQRVLKYVPDFLRAQVMDELNGR
jgi:hypothetical protein